MSDFTTVVTGTPVYAAGNAKFGSGGFSGAIIGATGADSFLSSTGADGGNLTTGTVEAWVKHPATTSTRTAFAHPGWYWAGAAADGKATARYGPTGAEVTLGSNIVIADDAWHHIALVFVAGVANLYVDGVKTSAATTAKATSSAAGGAQFYIGGLGSSGFQWQGAIDEVRISNTAKYAGTYAVPTAAFVSGSSTVALYHLDASGVDTALPDMGADNSPVTIAPNDANIVYSPYNWNVTSTQAKTINAGAYLRTTLSGTATSLKAKFDLTNALTPLPQISFRVDGGSWTSTTIAADVTIPMPTNNTWGAHLVEILVKATTETQNRWNAPQNTAVVFLGFSADPSSITTRTTRTRKLYVLAYGDSITEGVRTLALNGAGGDVDRNDSASGWAYPLGELMGAEVGVVGFGGHGIVDTGGGNVPGMVNTYNLLWAGQARSFTTPQAPDLILLNQGTNDKVDIIDSTKTVLNNLLAATPSTTKIGVIIPWNTNRRADLIAGVAACDSTRRVKVIDTPGWFVSSDASDGIHPYGYTNLVDLSPRIATAARAILGSGGTYLNVGGVAKPISPVVV
ncbi:LamG-like jellyroll fold domain-containing protein [Arthrobacter sp. NPDC058288]|uniref:LamG-like jellyroll fold domain-containing protein n=1 Tax=Arthrobacter sp. NPDC058288 TaxID=3346424 RepID=UPI0036E9F8F2